jgi:hypothetical protein
MKLKLESLYVGYAALALFAFFLNAFIKTTFLLELVLVTNLCVYAAQQKRFGSINGNTASIIVLAALSFLLICFGILFNAKVDNEAYRLLFIPLIYFSFAAIKLNYRTLIRAVFWLSVIGGIYNIFDVFYFNLILAGNISEHFAASSLAALEDTQYDRLATFFGLFPFFRPFGIFGQPQKSAFISSLGILSYYFLAQLEGRTLRHWKAYLISLFFLISGLVTGGTTGILASAVLLAIIFGGEFGFVVSSGLVLGGIAAILVAIYFVLEHPLYYNAFSKDVSGLFGGDAFHLAMGSGFVSAEDLFKDGFGHEHFIFRVIYEVGLLPFLIWMALLLASVFRNGLKRAGVLIFVLFFFMVVHYSITNVYFVVLFLCFNMCVMPKMARGS